MKICFSICENIKLLLVIIICNQGNIDNIDNIDAQIIFLK